MSEPQVCTVDGGLINPALLPAKSADLDTTKITGAADDLRTMGSTVDTRTDEIKTTWGGLTGCYQAPEQAEVYALMNDPATASEDVKTTFGTMAGYLDTYAAELETIKPKLADFEQRAQAFRDEVIDGVWVNATEASDAHVGTYLESAGRWLVGADQERKKVPWYEDGDTVEKNQDFVKEIGGIYADVSAAAATCATSINGLTSLPPESRKVEGIPEEAFYNPESPMPWGSPREEDRNCPESVGHGAYQFGKNTVEGLGQLISYNPETGEWGDWGHAGQAWMGTGNVLLSLAVTSVGTVGFTQLMKATGNGDNPVVQWLDERHQVASTVVTGLVGIDLNADDPFHRWKEDGVATFTESFLNVGTMFIPGAGQAGAAVKVAGLGSKIARVTGAIADFGVPGGSWLVKGGLHTVPVLRNVFRFADEIPVTALDDVARAGARTPTFNPGALIDDVADVPTPRPPGKPVSTSLFGEQTPGPANLDGTPPRTTTLHPDTPAVRPEAPEPNGSAARPDGRPAPEQPANPADPANPAEPAGGLPDADPQPQPDTAPDADPHPAADPDTHPDADPDGAQPAGTDPTDPGGGQPGEHPVDTDTTPTDHSSSEHGDPGHSENPGEAPDGGRAEDRYGREYTFDDDGRRHLPGDDPGTFRDRNGQLHGPDGAYAPDHNRPDAGDLEVQKAEKGESHDVTLDDPSAQAAHDRLVQARTEAEQAAVEASNRLDEAIADAGIDPADLSGSTADAAAKVEELRESGVISRSAARDLTSALHADRQAAQAWRTASEALGDQATAAVSHGRGEIPLIDAGQAGANRLDHAALGSDPPHLSVYEGKGGNSGLGYRTVDGVRVQQGTAPYLNSVAQADSRLLEGLREFLDDPKADPAIKDAIRTGTLEIRYELVQALPSGRIKVTRFVLDPSALRLPGIGK